MKIGELAKIGGVSTQAVRFYEREGLLPDPPRTAGGYRDYGDAALGNLVFIREAKAVGFTLREIKQLAGADPKSSLSCGMMQDLLRSKLDDLDKKISAMRVMKKRLTGFLAECEERAESESCPVLHEIGKAH